MEFNCKFWEKNMVKRLNFVCRDCFRPSASAQLSEMYKD